MFPLFPYLQLGGELLEEHIVMDVFLDYSELEQLLQQQQVFLRELEEQLPLHQIRMEKHSLELLNKSMKQK